MTALVPCLRLLFTLTKMRLVFPAAVLIALLAGVSADFEGCTRCQLGICASNACYLHCLNSCPNGYASIDVNSTSGESYSCTPVDSSTNSTDGDNDDSSDKNYVCFKCNVENCLRCPADNYDQGCSQCNDRFELVVNVTEVTFLDGSGNGTETQNVSRAQCVRQATVPPDTQGGGSTPEVDAAGSSGDNTVAVAVGVAVAGVAVLAVAAGVVFLLWRRRKSHAGSAVALSMVKPRKRKSQDSDEEERSDSRYTKSPVGPMRDPPSTGNEISEVTKLGFAPPPPADPSNYDALERQNSVQPYGQLELKPATPQTEDVYGNTEAIQQANRGKDPHANSNVTPNGAAAKDDAPSDIYGNDEILQAQGQGDEGQGPNKVYMDMSGNQPALVEEDLYQNDKQPADLTRDGLSQDVEYLQPSSDYPGSGSTPDGLTQDVEYLQPSSDYPGSGSTPDGLSQDVEYLQPSSDYPESGGVAPGDEIYSNDPQLGDSQGPYVEENVYLNQPSGLVEESIYGNT